MKNLAILAATAVFAFSTINVQASKIESLTDSLIHAGVHYEMGAKVNPLTLQAGEFTHVDCSGFVKWAIYHATAATGQPLIIVDGSIAQHGWFRTYRGANGRGFKQSTFEDGKLKDNVVRIAFLPPTSSLGPGERHVMLIVNGFTCESHGKTLGVSRREWGSQGWMQECEIFVVAMPEAA